MNPPDIPKGTKGHSFDQRFFLLIFVSVIVRILGIQRPLLGNFAIYQTAQAMIAKSFLESHFSNWLYPQINVLAAGKPGLILLYYPISSLLVALSRQLTHLPIDILGRLQAVVFFATSAIYLYRLVSELLGEKEAWWATAVYSFLPLAVIYGQSFQNEMATVCFTAMFFYHFYRALNAYQWPHIITAALAMAMVLITRPNNLYLAVPAFYLMLQKGKEPLKHRLQIGAWVMVLSFILPAAWFWHLWTVSQEQSNIYSTLFQQLQVRSSFVSKTALEGPYFADVLLQLAGIVLTPVGFLLFVLGVFAAHERKNGKIFFFLWAFSFMASSLLIPRKLLDHNFYWLHFVIAASPVMALGFAAIPSKIKSFFIIGVLFFSFRYAYHPAFVTPASDQTMLPLAAQIQKLTEKEKTRLIVQGTHTLLYYADRNGWTFMVENPSREVSDYYKHMNWEKLSPQQWEIRNKAFETPISMLEYRRQYDGATHFAVNDSKYFKDKEIAQYLDTHYKRIFEDPSLGVIYDIR